MVQHCETLMFNEDTTIIINEDTPLPRDIVGLLHGI